ncbi:Hypothetical protein PBC10988_16010 [Planctomycetales bacterium 10988]|nr:Hypothetical protein PBC10988_16010 [Planctomycetales bacterium 10988]
MSDIFAKIWNLPESHLSVTRRGPDGSPVDPTAKIVLDEQRKAKRCLNDPAPDRPLFRYVDESVFEEPSFRTFIALLDNYTAIEGEPERSFADTSHNKEIDNFLKVVFESKPMTVAFEFIKTELEVQLSDDELKAKIKRMWFESFTNRYGAVEPNCVGFEHIFIGEDESSPHGAPNCEDRVGGYHSWVKYYLDQKAGKVRYLGHDYYSETTQAGRQDPHVATIVMAWSPTKAEDRAHGNTILKKPGGFFVGTRPELEMAFGTVGMFLQAKKKYNNTKDEDHHRVKLGENYFDIVLHAEALSSETANSSAPRGEHIRTLYPKFRGKEARSPLPTRTIEIPTQSHNNGPLRIARALPNPRGTDTRGEWVELVNVTADTIFELSEWRLFDDQGRAQLLEGNLEPGESIRIELTRTDENSMMLRNNGTGWILLYLDDKRKAAVHYENPASGEILRFYSQ